MPLTLHAAWLRRDEPLSDGRLFFWVESLESNPEPRSDPTAVLANGPANGLTKEGTSARLRVKRPSSHPGQTPINQVRTLIAEEIPSLPTELLQPATAVVWLPTRGDLPLARRGVVQNTKSPNGSPGPMEPIALRNWQVTGLTLAPHPALFFLSQLRLASTDGALGSMRRIHRLRMGNDLLYWSNAAKLAMEILIGQHYLPVLRMNGGTTLYTDWQPILLDDRLKRRFSTLVETMPPVCRAYNLESIDDAPLPVVLTEQFIATMVDGAVRAWASIPAVEPAGSPALQWVQQLHSTGRSLTLPPQPAYRLLQDWQSWIEQLHVTSDANFRISFELVEPDGSAGSAGQTGNLDDGQLPISGEHTQWTLRYYLQARDDVRLLIPAEQVWSAHNGALRYGNRRVDRPQERLLAGLGAASRLFPPIERSLHSIRPEFATLSPEEAHRFLTEIAPLLESNGFGVLLPDWWNARQRTRLGLRLRLFGRDHALWNADDDLLAESLPAPRPRSAPVRYAWELTLGSERISQAEFDRLTALKTPLLKLRGRWIELDPEQVTAAKRFMLDRKATGEMSLLQSIRMAQAYLEQVEAARVPAVAVQGDNGVTLSAVTAEPMSAALPLEAVDVDGWLRTVLDHLRTQKLVADLQEPEGFVGELRPYQRRGLGWLVYLRRLGLGACLADDMGLGKTVQAIAMLLHEQSLQRAKGAEPKGRRQPVLLICPTSVVTNWRREVERFGPQLRALVHHGGNRLDGESFLVALSEHDLVITSYGTARRDIDVLQQVQWSDLILDEAQNIKNPNAKQSQAVRKLNADNRVALTGTPVENHLTELWSVLEFLNPGYLGTHEQFRQQFVVPIERYNDEEQAADLRRLVQPFLLRRLKTDPNIISDLPEKNEMVVYCSLTHEQATLYEATVQESLAILDRADGIKRRGLVLSLLTKLKQICNHPVQYLKESGPLDNRSGKLARLTEMLEEALSVGDHALVFTQFVEMGTLIQQHLRKRLHTDVLFLHGGTSAAERDRMIQSFQDDDGPPIFVLSLRAGGSGINLTRANHVFHYDRWWNPAVENQATDRAFRIGQVRNVQVHKFVVAGTLEDRIHDIIESKQALAESIVGAGESWLTELDTDQLREILKLRREMLDE